MTKEEFMNTVYSELYSDGDDHRANRIIDAANEYAVEQARWIPVSERLPEVYGRYLVSTKNLTGYAPLENQVFICVYIEGGDWLGFDKDFDNEIIAWMPLPEPYVPDINDGNKAESEVKRINGKWIPQDHNITNGMMSTSVYYYPKCSVCGYCANYTNFCPNCGSKMM